MSRASNQTEHHFKDVHTDIPDDVIKRAFSTLKVKLHEITEDVSKGSINYK